MKERNVDQSNGSVCASSLLEKNHIHPHLFAFFLHIISCYLSKSIKSQLPFDVWFQNLRLTIEELSLFVGGCYRVKIQEIFDVVSELFWCYYLFIYSFSHINF